MASASLVLWLCVLLLIPPHLRALSLPACTEQWQKPQGYTYIVDPATGQKVWSFCQFPDPRYDHAFCGLPDWSQPSFLCDPDNLIGSDQEALSINSNLLSIQTTTPHQCTGADNVRQTYIMAMVLVDRIRVGSPYSADSCVNSCGEIYPTVNTTARAPTDDEISVAMETFANRVRLHLGMGACGNDLLMLYSREYDRVYTSMGSRVADVLDSSALSDLEGDFLTYVHNGQLAQGLLFISQQLQSDLIGLKPSTVMLIITLISALLLFLFMVFFLHANDTDYNVWGHEGPSKVADIAVKTITGVYLIQLLFVVMTHISGRIPLWPMFVLLIAAVACLVVFFATNNLYNKL